MVEHSSRRLGSWKEIASYVGRDARTVARWEKERGFPVRRLPGGPRSSVFAYTDEIDVWMRGASAAAEPTANPPTVVPAIDPPILPPPRNAKYWLLAAAIVLLAGLVLMSYPWGRRLVITDIQAEGTEVSALSGGTRLWSHHLDLPVRFAPVPQQYQIADVDDDGAADAVAAVHVRSAERDAARLLYFTSEGALRWQQTLEQSVVYGSETYAGPWGSGPVIVQKGSTGTRVVWATHHYTWWPAVVAMIDRDGYVRGRFMHPGWITAMHALPADRIVLAGISNEHDSDVVAVLDDESWPGAAPPGGDAAFACRGCPEGRPLRYFIVPRTELNALAGTPRLQAHIHSLAGGITVRTYQNGNDAGGGELILEFAPDMTPIRARMSDAYWTWHHRMETEGRVRHSADACPDRRGVELREWRRGAGWSRLLVPSSAHY
ncbi:MAG TPA: hypothetical protein VFV66_02895 [Nonomuraea sp.]|nr:hypothetical protein [Nonomuraea sp.]